MRRALSFERKLSERISPRVRRFDGGVAFFNVDAPSIYDLNFLLVTAGLERGPSAPALAAHADRVQGAAGLRHRQIRIQDARLGRTLTPWFQRHGWKVTRLLWMSLTELRDGDETRRVDEVDVGEYTALAEATTRAEPWGKDPEVVRGLNEKNRLLAELTGARFFAVRRYNRLVSGCHLYSDGRTAQIEEVGTLERHRNRGLARAVVSAAALAALEEACDLVFLVADDYDWPKNLYRKMGFEALGRTYQFLLTQA
ncbi:MAG: GNAT family N-acetyltransferase [Actinomycetota bacterium]